MSHLPENNDRISKNFTGFNTPQCFKVLTTYFFWYKGFKKIEKIPEQFLRILIYIFSSIVLKNLYEIYRNK